MQRGDEVAGMTLLRLAGLSITLVLALAACQTISDIADDSSTLQIPPRSQAEVIEEAIQRISADLVEAAARIADNHIDKPDRTALLEIALGTVAEGMIESMPVNDIVIPGIKAMLGSLDGHNALMANQGHEQNSPEEVGAVGLTQIRTDSGWVIAFVHPNGALGDSPVRSGWQLVEADGVDVTDLADEFPQPSIRGRVGSTARLAFTDLDGRRVELAVERVSRKSLVPAVGECGVRSRLRLLNFSSATSASLKKLLDRCLDHGMRQLTIDLRGNTGGTMAALKATTALFTGEVVMFRSRGRTAVTEWHQKGAIVAVDVPVMLLVDRYTSSAAEIFANSLRRLAGAHVVGQVTYGDDEIHTILSAGKYGHMTLLTGRFEGASGTRSVPVTPDVELVDDFATEPDEVLSALPRLWTLWRP
jgi:C-terminal processing protease CtpA/Prc